MEGAKYALIIFLHYPTPKRRPGECQACTVSGERGAVSEFGSVIQGCNGGVGRGLLGPSREARMPRRGPGGTKVYQKNDKARELGDPQQGRQALTSTSR